MISLKTISNVVVVAGFPVVAFMAHVAGDDWFTWAVVGLFVIVDFAHLQVDSNRPARMVFHCPRCDKPHVDRGEWATRPHRTHLCLHCDYEWRPADFPTVGIEPHSPARAGDDK